jgi:hypothetical protein
VDFSKNLTQSTAPKNCLDFLVFHPSSSAITPAILRQLAMSEFGATPKNSRFGLGK